MVFRMYSWFGNIYKQPLQGMPSLFSLKHALEKSFLAWHSQFCLFEMVHTFFLSLIHWPHALKTILWSTTSKRCVLRCRSQKSSKLDFPFERENKTRARKLRWCQSVPLGSKTITTDTNGSDNRCAGQTVRYSKKGNTLAGGDYRSLCLPYRSWLIFL